MSITREDSRIVANTIIAQMGGGGRLKAMIGAHSFLALDAACGGLQFDFKAGQIANRVRIELNGLDLYDILILKITKRGGRFTGKGLNARTVGQLDNAYSDMLKEFFEKTTGLYLTL